MDVPTLLQEMEKLKHKDRIKKMVLIGQKSRDDPQFISLISKLATGSLYEQRLALATCYGSRDIGIAKLMFSTPSKDHAILHISLFGADIELLEALQSVPEYLQVSTLRRLRSCRLHRRRPAVIDAFLRLILSLDNNKLFCRLLPLGTREMIQIYLPTIIDTFSKSDWSCLTRFQPKIALKALKKWIMDSEDDGDRITRASGAALQQFVSRENTVDFGLELLLVLLQTKIYIPSSLFEDIGRKRPEQVLDLMIEFNQSIPYTMFRKEKLAKLSVPKLLVLVESYPSHLTAYDFPNFTMAQRSALYGVVRIGWRSLDSSLSQEVVELLPAELRMIEARRIAHLQAFDSSPSRRIPYIALLPWNEAIPLQKAFIESGESAIRQSALYSQIRAAIYDKQYLDDALKLALKQKNDQDPVRDEILRALGKIPVVRWNEGHLNDLAQIFQHSRDAVDISNSSLIKIFTILGNALSVHSRWAAQQIRLHLTHRNEFDFHQTINLSGIVPVNDVMAIVAEELAGVVKTASETKNLSKLMMLADTFGKNILHWSELLDALENILTVAEGFQDSVVLTVLKIHRPSTWHVLMANLNGSYVTWAEMKLEYIHSYRQDMLSYYFEQMLYPQIEKPAFKNITAGFLRWTQSQQEGLAQLILEGIENPEEDDWEKRKYIKQLASLQFVGEAHLLKLAKHSVLFVRDLALRSLGHFGGKESRLQLVGALLDERARVAIYALRNSIRRISPLEALEILRKAPMKKITVAKEVIRLIGDLQTGAALEYLVEYDKQDLHIDVRVSLFRALWSFLEIPETWEIYSRAAQGAHLQTAKALCFIPEDGMTSISRKRFYELMIQLFYHPNAEVRIEALGRCQKIPLKDPNHTLAPRLFELVLSPLPEEVEAASRALFSTYSKSQPQKIADMYHRLLSDRLRLQQIHAHYISEPAWLWRDQQKATLLILAVLAEDRLSVSMRLDLMFRKLQWKDAKTYFYEIIPELHADALLDAHSQIHANVIRRTSQDNLEAEIELLKSEDEKGRRLALAFLLASISSTTGWTDEQRERLDRYREDESAMVAERAWKVIVPERDRAVEIPFPPKGDWVDLNAQPGDSW